MSIGRMIQVFLSASHRSLHRGNWCALIPCALLLCVLLGSCGSTYSVADFRRDYTNYNDLLHDDSAHQPYLKAHFKNGDVALFTDWHFDSARTTITGVGVLYNFNRQLIDTSTRTFALTDIALFETNRLHEIVAEKNWWIGPAILAAGDFAVTLYCITHPKSCFGSCPTFYLDGDSDLFSARAEGFSSAVAPSLAYQDIDALRFRTDRNSVAITMKNEALETHYVDQVQLLAVAVADTENALQSLQDSFYICSKLRAPTKATAAGGSILNELRVCDQKEYFAKTDSSDFFATEDIYLEFDGPANGRQGLVLNFRQTLAPTYIFYSGLATLGDNASDIYASVERSLSTQQRIRSTLPAKASIIVSVPDSLGTGWNRVASVYETGPIAKNLEIVPLPINSNSGRPIRIKLTLPKGMWRLDYAALTTILRGAAPEEVKVSRVTRAGVLDTGAMARVNGADHLYLATVPGDEYRLEFELPVHDSRKNELFVSSTGYYLEWQRKEWYHEKNLARFALLLFGDTEAWHQLAHEYKQYEDGMESDFWHSRFQRNE